MPPYWPPAWGRYGRESSVWPSSVWPSWVAGYAPTGATINPTWYAWVEEHGEGTRPSVESAMRRVIWNGWQTQLDYQQTAPPETAEQRAKREAEVKRNRLIQRNRERARMLRRKIAERVAERLLLQHLTPTQRTEWEQGKFFHVETADGRRRYRVDRGTAGNVRLVKCDAPPPVKADRVRIGSRFCAHVYHPDGPIPHEDNVLAQKLLLESDGGEEAFLTMANVS